jgi:hypothetical protein
MMLLRSASQLFHAAVGAPPDPEAHAVDGAPPCWVCGAPVIRGRDREAWASESMTDQTQCRAPSSTWVCEACLYVRGGKPGSVPAGTHTMPTTIRLLSHLYDESATPRVVHPTKANKPEILAFLRRPHAGVWFAAIADSGKKHVVSYAPTNPPGARGRVQFEDQTVALPDAAGWRIVDDLVALLTAGATKAEVERGDYSPRAWGLCRDRIEAFERAHGYLRGGAWFALALWLSQRDEAAVAERMSAEADARRAKAAKAAAATPRPAKVTRRGAKPQKEVPNGTTDRRAERAATDGDGRVPARRARGVPRDTDVQRAEALGADAEPRTVGGATVRDGGRVEHEPASRPAGADAKQLGLPGCA